MTVAGAETGVEKLERQQYMYVCMFGHIGSIDSTGREIVVTYRVRCSLKTSWKEIFFSFPFIFLCISFCVSLNLLVLLSAYKPLIGQFELHHGNISVQK